MEHLEVGQVWNDCGHTRKIIELNDGLLYYEVQGGRREWVEEYKFRNWIVIVEARLEGSDGNE